MSPEQERLLKDVNDRLKRVESNLGGLTNDPRQVQVILNALLGEKVRLGNLEVKNNTLLKGDLTVKGDTLIEGDTALAGALQHTGLTVGFFSTTPVSKQANIAKPVGGGTVDTEARAAIDKLIDTFDNYGLTA